MELFSLTVRGFRRFKSETSLRTNGKVIAVLGPNEAGKSSILHGLTYINHHDEPPRTDISRGVDPKDFLISAKFLLSKEETQEAGLSFPQWVAIERRNDSTHYYDFDPSPKDRDTSLRQTASDALDDVLGHSKIVELEGRHGPDFISNMQVALEDACDSEDESLAPEIMGRLSESFKSFNRLASTAQDKKIDAVVASIKNLVESERAPTPTKFAIDTLAKKVPQFLIFDQEARNLQSSYSTDQLRNSIPLALRNLADVAELDFDKLFEVVDAGDGAAITTLERKANKVLEQKFGESWRQSEIRVSLRLTPALLEILVVNEAEEFSALAERSDGLRQFVALQTFVMRRHASSPILLVDEAESKLHYDAQADLAQMFARQQLASKVVYTTHSAGCLPEDLGNGVRLVRPTDCDNTASEIVNKFWAAKGDGFTPLLIGMGASTLAFFPTRRAVLVEGPTDTLLYPTLFRETLGSNEVGFQFVPGLSSTAQLLGPLLPGGEIHIGFLVDGDPGGESLRQRLIASGVRADRIVQLSNGNRSAVEPEDFISPSKLITAANSLLAQFHVGVAPLSVADLTTARRMASLEAAYEEKAGVKLPKVELAYLLLESLDEQPGSRLLDPKRAKAFAAFCQKVRALFKESEIKA